jgi:hypothetical protein
LEEANQAIFRVPGCSVLDPESFISITGAVMASGNQLERGTEGRMAVVYFDSVKKDLVPKKGSREEIL